MAEVPAAVVTVTSTVPVPAGLSTTIWVAESLAILAAVLPRCTDVALARYVPAIVSEAPPVTGPCEGLSSVTAGAWIPIVMCRVAVSPSLFLQADRGVVKVLLSIIHCGSADRARTRILGKIRETVSAPRRRLRKKQSRGESLAPEPAA
jgi:TRAP-type uncharacterized transport system fused permease subunit